MNIEREEVKLYFSEPIEEPLMVFVGEGSGEDSKVGNEEKKKIFFFGQPGCLKHSPIKPNPPENHNNHKALDGENSTASVKDEIVAQVVTPKKQEEVSDDEDGGELLQKISKALEDEPSKNAAVASTERPLNEKSPPISTKDVPVETVAVEQPAASPDVPVVDQVETASKQTTNASCATNKSEIKKDSQLMHESKIEESEDCCVEPKKFVESSCEISSKAEVIDSAASSSKETVNEISSDTLVVPPVELQSNNANDQICIATKIESNPVSLMKSIVPYDDDSTSSSSIAEVEKEIPATEDKSSEMPQLDKSASLPSGNDDRLVESTPTENTTEDDSDACTAKDSHFKAVEISDKREELSGVLPSENVDVHPCEEAEIPSRDTDPELSMQEKESAKSYEQKVPQSKKEEEKSQKGEKKFETPKDNLMQSPVIKVVETKDVIENENPCEEINSVESNPVEEIDNVEQTLHENVEPSVESVEIEHQSNEVPNSQSCADKEINSVESNSVEEIDNVEQTLHENAEPSIESVEIEHQSNEVPKSQSFADKDLVAQPAFQEAISVEELVEQEEVLTPPGSGTSFEDVKENENHLPDTEISAELQKTHEIKESTSVKTTIETETVSNINLSPESPIEQASNFEAPAPISHEETEQAMVESTGDKVKSELKVEIEKTSVLTDKNPEDQTTEVEAQIDNSKLELHQPLVVPKHQETLFEDIESDEEDIVDDDKVELQIQEEKVEQPPSPQTVTTSCCDSNSTEAIEIGEVVKSSSEFKIHDEAISPCEQVYNQPEVQVQFESHVNRPSPEKNEIIAENYVTSELEGSVNKNSLEQVEAPDEEKYSEPDKTEAHESIGSVNDIEASSKSAKEPVVEELIKPSHELETKESSIHGTDLATEGCLKLVEFEVREPVNELIAKESVVPVRELEVKESEEPFKNIDPELSSTSGLIESSSLSQWSKVKESNPIEDKAMLEPKDLLNGPPPLTDEPQRFVSKLSTDSNVRELPDEIENIESPDDFNEFQDDDGSDQDSYDSGGQLQVIDTNDEKKEIDLEEPTPENQAFNPPEKTFAALEAVTADQSTEEVKISGTIMNNNIAITSENLTKISDLPEPTTDLAEPVENLSTTQTTNSSELVEHPIDKIEQKPSQPSQHDIKIESAVDVGDKAQKLTMPAPTRKRKISERKSISESDSDGNVADTVSNENSSDEEEEVVLKKKPRMRGKTASPRKVQPARKSAAAKKAVEPAVTVEKTTVIEKTAEVKSEMVDTKKTIEVELKTEESVEVKPGTDETESKQTLQTLKFDFDGTEDIVANVAAIRTLICKEPKKESASEPSDDEGSEKRVGNKRSRKTRGRLSKRPEVESSSDDDSAKESKKMDSKRSKPGEQASPNKKKREVGTKGMLKYIDTSLVIETTENEAPVRQSRRIAQQKIREETERRQMEEKMLKQMKLEAQKKKKDPSDVTEDEVEAEPEVEDDPKGSSGDESYKGTPRKKKSKIKASDKQWQTSSSHSENSESEEYLEHVPSDPGSPLFKSDHEFSPESDVDDTTQIQPVKRARTAKKIAAVSSDDEEDINPKHACQVCHKTDSPEWILLCDECDCGYHCSCLKPIIFLIPSGNWFCPLCCHKKLVENLSDQLTQLDTLIYNIETAEIRKERQKQVEISEQNILQERRKIRAEKERESREISRGSKDSSGSSESENSSENAPLTDYFYKLRKRNQTAAPSYRFNEYDDLINSAIREEMDDVKVAGNLGRGKDISTIIEADNEENKEVKEGEPTFEGEQQPAASKPDNDDSSGSDVIRPKKLKRKKKKKLNNLDVSSDEERVSDEDFKGSTPSSDSEVDEEDLSMSSVSESSLDLPSKKNKGRNVRTSTRTRVKRVDRRFINDGNSDSDDEPLIKAKRSKKKNDSDEEEFDINDDEDDEGSLAEEIDSEDLCDDTDTDDSSEGNWPRKKKKRVASYDQKPRKAPKKNETEDKAFRAGISKKKVLKKSDNESEASASETEKGRRKTRGKKLLYLIEDDLDSDESDGIKPGVKRPETPPEEREMFVKKQEEIKRMLAAKDTEAAKKLAAPTIEPINIAMERPKSPSPIPFSNEPASLSTIPKNVIESAKALDTDYNRIKPIAFGSQSRNDGSLHSNDMNEEELAKMMEEEDFAQHQLKLAGEAIARSKKLLELEAKEEEFAAFSKSNREKASTEWPPVESKKRSRKSKSSEKTGEEYAGFSKGLPASQAIPANLSASLMPPLVSSSVLQLPKHHMQMQPQSSLIANLIQQQSQPSLMANLMQQQLPFNPTPPNLTGERPSVLSSFMTRPEMHPQLMKMHQPIPPDVFTMKNQPLPTQPFDENEEKKKGRRKKFTPLRTDLVEGNISKLAKLDPPTVIQSAINPSADRVDDKHKVPRPDLPKLAVAAPPQIFNPATNPTPSVITRLLQPQQRPGPGPYPQGFTTDVGQPLGGENPNIRMYPEDTKNVSPSKARATMQQAPPLVGALPQASFGELPFVPRTLHTLYRGPPGFHGIPPHSRLPPYPFHHLHPNLRPGEYSAPYNIPPQFSYYAPPAHSRQPPQASAIPLNHGASQLVAGNEDISNSIRNANNSEEPSETSEFGGLVSYFSSQQELD